MQYQYYYGIDIHSKQHVVCRMDAAGQCEYQNYDNTEEGREALVRELSAHGPCAVGMEACTGAWALYQLLVGVVARVEIIDPKAFRERFPKKGKKTDVRDARNLAQYMKEEHGGIWVPDKVTRHRRQLTQVRESTNKMLTQAKNIVHASLKEHNVSYRFLGSSLWTQKARRWLLESGLKRLSLAAQVAVSQNLGIIDLLSEQQKAVEAMMAAECEQCPEMQIVASHPGIGVVAAYVIMAEIGDIKRFRSAKNLASFAGIAPGVSQTGGPEQLGAHLWITRHGRSRLRWIVVECALSAVKGCESLRNLYNRLVRRSKIKGKARVAVGHKLLIHIWHMLTKNRPYDKLDTVKNAKKVALRKKLAATYTAGAVSATDQPVQGREDAPEIKRPSEETLHKPNRDGHAKVGA